jgi:hypothetical protein
MTFIRLIISYVLGGAATVLLFLGVSASIGEFSSGIHSDAVIVLFAFPFAWAGAYRLLVRTGFPPSGDPPESRD